MCLLVQVGDTFIKRPICDHRLTVVFEDSDCGPRESGSQDQRGMVQFIAQNQAALQDTKHMSIQYPLVTGNCNWVEYH